MLREREKAEHIAREKKRIGDQILAVIQFAYTQEMRDPAELLKEEVKPLVNEYLALNKK